VGSGRSPCPVASGTVYLSSAALLSGGFVYALDGATGKTRWSFDSVIDPAGDKIIGGGAWNPPAIGPDGTVYIGFGNMHQPAAAALAHPGKRLYTDSTVALDGKTGKLKWYFQAVPNDFHDWDMQLSPIYTHIGGRAVIVNAGKMGYVYAMDAASGKLVWKTKVGVHNGTHSREPPTRARRRSRPRSASGRRRARPRACARAASPPRRSRAARSRSRRSR